MLDAPPNIAEQNRWLEKLEQEIAIGNLTRDSFGNVYPNSQQELYEKLLFDNQESRVSFCIFVSLVDVILGNECHRITKSIIGPSTYIEGTVTSSVVDGVQIVGRMTEVRKAVVSRGAKISAGAMLEYANVYGEGTEVLGKGTMVVGANTEVFGGAKVLDGCQVSSGAKIFDGAVIRRYRDEKKMIHGAITRVCGEGTEVSGPATEIISSIIRKGTQIRRGKIERKEIAGGIVLR